MMRVVLWLALWTAGMLWMDAAASVAALGASALLCAIAIAQLVRFTLSPAAPSLRPGRRE